MRNILRLPPRGTARPTHHPILAVCAVLLGPFIVGFHSRLFGIGLVDLRAAFGLGVDESAWLNTLSTAPQIVLAPCVAWLAATFGVRRVTVIPALLYALLSLAIPFVRQFELLALLHVIHGTLLGVFVPATLLIIFRNLPVRWWVSAIAIYAFRSAFTANAGTALLDFYVQHLGWQYLYWQDVALAPVMAILALFGAPHEEVDQDLVRDADWGGMLLLGFGLGLLFVAIDQGNRLDWFENGFVTAAIVGGCVLIVAFFVNEALVKKPWANIRVVGARNIALLLSIALLYLLSALSNTSLISNYLSTLPQLRPEQIGQTLVIWCCIPLFMLTPMAVWAMHRIDGRWVLLIGLSCFASAALLGTGLTGDWSGDNFRAMCVLQGAGHILTFLPIIVLTIGNASPRNATALAAYIQVVRLLGTETAQALMTTFLRKREQLYSFLIGLNVEKGGDLPVAALSGLTRRLAPLGQATAQLRGTGILGQAVQRQANVLSFIDGFWVTFWAAAAGLVVLAFVTKAPPGPLTKSHLTV
jgi:DHA2 family multidrug resistance protein